MADNSFRTFRRDRPCARRWSQRSARRLRRSARRTRPPDRPERGAWRPRARFTAGPPKTSTRPHLPSSIGRPPMKNTLSTATMPTPVTPPPPADPIYQRCLRTTLMAARTRFQDERRASRTTPITGGYQNGAVDPRGSVGQQDPYYRDDAAAGGSGRRSPRSMPRPCKAATTSRQQQLCHRRPPIRTMRPIMIESHTTRRRRRRDAAAPSSSWLCSAWRCSARPAHWAIAPCSAPR